jgi:ketosteroid isomerase-like protein
MAELRDLGDRVLVVGKQRGRGRASGVEVESRRALVVELRDGTLRSVRYFLEPNEAFAAVALER